MTLGAARVLAPVLLLALAAAAAAPGASAGEPESSGEHPGRRCEAIGPGATSLEPACLTLQLALEGGALASAEAGGAPGYARAEASAAEDACADARTGETPHEPEVARRTCAAAPDAGWILATLAPSPGAPALPAPMLRPPAPLPPAPPQAPPPVAPHAAPPAAPTTPDPPAAPEPEAAIRGSLHLDEDEKGGPTARLGVAAAAPGVTSARAERVGEAPRAAGTPSAFAAAGAASPAGAGAPPSAGRAFDAAPVPGAGLTAGAALAGPEGPEPTTLRVAGAAPPPSADGSMLVLLAGSVVGPGLLAAAASLYHRLKRSEVLAHATRARIADALAGEPLTATKLAARLGVHRKTVEYHLRILRAYGLVMTWSSGRERLFGPAHARAGDGLSESARRVLAAVREHPGLGVSALARTLALSKGTLHHHVAALAARGLVRVERSFRGVGIHPADR